MAFFETVPLLLEAEIDNRIKVLVAKIYDETATESERKEYQELSRRRVQLMQPSPGSLRRVG